ncbi:heme-degrading domain-containing protein [Rhizobiaceae bacterium BDR2-2]|uniref:UPF0303 protein NOF55_14145 n=1 Tax=Ectorhizobium quercum TaxID=2965071 RepID=A0AAE3N2T2_9HYPH|nr:heme-degrading domain-containing protein [Ectorhizobium quercum]MCX8998250.1 heme-degrading domain-containing protein [Ectorhizobium quercum]
MALTDDIARIAEQEKTLIFPSFDENAAFKLGTTLHALAIGNGWGLTIDIRHFDRQLFFAATPGSAPENADWMRRKRNVVNHFHKSSYRVGLETRLKGTTLTERSGLAASDYAAHGGGFPVRIGGTGVIGSITVSGLPQRQDHETVVEVLCGLLGHDHAALALGPEE